MKIILASKSPRRIALMELAKFDFEVMPSSYDEKVRNMYDIEEISKELSYNKAKEIFENTQGNRTIIGADTIVVKDNKIYEKPKDREDAIRMLKLLRGDKHTVYTSVAILIEEQENYKEYKEVVKTEVYIKEMTDNEIEQYVDSGEAYDKAGAYGIQTSFSIFIEKIDGDYPSVLGLPINRIYDILKENGII
ncbi:MAG: septum formation protein Maf [Clostridia bacterium]|nr:septum formation protein Maf [Clostridia bacterium]